MTNRETRRAFKQVAKKGFSTAIAGDWGKWIEKDVHSKVHLGIEPPKGLKRFVANDRYSVQFYEWRTDWGLVIHLLIRQHDQKPVRSWAHMQQIKNELVGCDRVAVEVFPAEQDLVDEANCYHLWVLPEGFKLPFGLHVEG